LSKASVSIRRSTVESLLETLPRAIALLYNEDCEITGDNLQACLEALTEDITKPQMERPKNIYFEYYAGCYRKVYKEIDPVVNGRDWKALAAIQKSHSPTKEQWKAATLNFFNTPLADHRLWRLCERYPEFTLSAFDKFGKPCQRPGTVSSYAGGI
jgi:hypothetical protein